MSRSPGVAAAILAAAGEDPAPVFDCPYFDPNRHCYRLLRQVLEERRDGSAL